MTTINVTQTWINAQTYPLSLSANTSLILSESITLSAVDQYFIIGGSNILINGNYYTINITVGNYAGLVQNGTAGVSSVYTNIVIKNININTTNIPAANAGWICRQGFCNGTVSFCSTNGITPMNGGGIYGNVCCDSTATNCFSTGNIVGLFSGGIFGSYSLNCTATQCYTTGTINNYCGGIFGFGTNYTYDDDAMIPSNTVDQNGTDLNLLTTINNFETVSGSSAVACYSFGQIGGYSGGIFGYFAYKCTASNCYSYGTGTVQSGGIFASNFYNTTPTSPTCTANNCYTVGITLAGDGIYAYTGINNTTNIESYCKSEGTGVWKDCNAKHYLSGVGCVWIDISVCSTNVPYLLKSYNRQLYACPYKKIKCSSGTSSAGLITNPMYQILKVNGCKPPHCFAINIISGIQSWSKLHKGKYKIKIINGTKITVNTTVNTTYTWTNYNISNYLLKCTYKKCR